jgi:phosphoglycerate dehydrogenase-like enzyme
MHAALMILDERSSGLIYGEELRAEIGRQVRWLAGPLTREEAVKRPDLLSQADVIFSGWGGPVLDAAFLAQAPRLKAFFYGAGTIRSLTTDAFWERNIPIFSAYGMNAIPVAEYTLAMVFFSLKRGWHHVLETKRLGAFPPRPPMTGGYGSTVGLISLGMIGRLVRERLRPFDLRVIAYDPFLSAAEAQSLGVEKVALDELFQRSDVVSLHTPWLKETEGMIRGEHFRAMRPGTTFINTARGAIVDESGLIAALGERPDLTAVLDVTWPEPPVAGSPLYSLPNVILTPHIAGSQGNECRRMGRCMLEEYERWSRGEPVRWQISREKAKLLA